eukprot:5382162-Pyramimonas_sp.AAC.1
MGPRTQLSTSAWTTPQAGRAGDPRSVRNVEKDFEPSTLLPVAFVALAMRWVAVPRIYPCLSAVTYGIDMHGVSNPEL